MVKILSFRLIFLTKVLLHTTIIVINVLRLASVRGNEVIEIGFGAHNQLLHLVLGSFAEVHNTLDEVFGIIRIEHNNNHEVDRHK
jgi:hypothetical protein